LAGLAAEEAQKHSVGCQHHGLRLKIAHQHPQAEEQLPDVPHWHIEGVAAGFEHEEDLLFWGVFSGIFLYLTPKLDHDAVKAKNTIRVMMARIMFMMA
jgi:hypothetical protein